MKPSFCIKVFRMKGMCNSHLARVSARDLGVNSSFVVSQHVSTGIFTLKFILLCNCNVLLAE
jgi:hypothetical protein